MMKIPLQILLVSIWAIGFASAIANSAISATPKTPPPPNTKPGGGLDPSNSFCKKTNQRLTALIPPKTPGYTTASNPSFWFYIPHAPEDLKKGEFVLLSQDEKTVIYETDFQLPKTSGIVSISLPLSPENALKEGNYYHWYLRIYCKNSTRSRADLVVDGWVNRVAVTAETERLINAAAPDIWYDSLTRLGNLLLASPQDEKLKRDWYKLLEFIGEKELAKEPLAGPVLVNQD
ncbi:MAG: DUF928 domain-containing protein [Microcoleus sp.]